MLARATSLRTWAKPSPYFRFSSYNQRGPLESPFFRHFLRLVLSCINADFCVQGRIFQHFSSSTFFPLHHSRFLRFFRTFAPLLQNVMGFLLIFRGGRRFCIFFVKFEWIFIGISQNFNDFGKSDVKIFIFQRNLRIFAEILQNSDN